MKRFKKRRRIDFQPFLLYLYCNKLRAIWLQLPRRRGSVVGEIRVVGAGAEQVEDRDDVEGKNGGGHTAATQKGRETTVEEDTGAHLNG